MSSFAAACAVALLAAAAADSTPSPSPSPSPSEAFTPRILSAYVRGGVNLYLSDAQTAGGVGGGVGARMTFDERFFGQLDVSQMVMIGTPTLVRAGAGIQRRGTWAPSATLSGTFFVGDRLRFLREGRTDLVRAPAMALGVNVSPLRWVSGTSEITLLELGAGIGWDFPGRGTAINVGLLEIAIRL